jgi:hypothetical protein
LKRRELLGLGVATSALAALGKPVRARTNAPLHDLPGSVQFERPSLVIQVSPTTQILSARLNGLRQFIRLDLPNPSPDSNTPWVLFAHGWVGPKAAPLWRFNLDPGSYYGDLIERFRQSGYAVAFPGYRGHGTFHRAPAEGLEYLKAFDNESHLIPIFYALDLIAASLALQERFHSHPAVFGHSQGADSALIALGVANDLDASDFRPYAASLWAGTIASRAVQFAAFDAERLNLPSYAYYDRARRALEGFFGSSWTNDEAETWISHLDFPSRLAQIQTSIQLHYSDQDRYSPPTWNEQVFAALNPALGHAQHFYPDNTHQFELAPQSRATSQRGRELMMQRTITFFRERNSSGRP